MGLEPQVVESVKHNRNRIRIQKAGVFTVLIACDLASILLIVFTLVSGTVSSQDILQKILISQQNSAKAFLGFCIAVSYLLIVAIGGVIFFWISRKGFRLFTTPITNFDHISFRKFENSVEAVSIAAGIPTPKTVVLDMPIVNVLAFLDFQRKAHVGVTRGALEADLTLHEAEAMVSHEVSHIVIGDNVEPPVVWSFYGIACLLTMLLFLSFLLAAYVLIPQRVLDSEMAVVLMMTIPPLLILLFVLFLKKRFNALRFHDDLLADSVAVKITGNPDALISAIKKANSTNIQYVKQFGISELEKVEPLKRYMFVSPHVPPGEYHDQIREGVMRKSPGMSEKQIKELVSTAEEVRDEEFKWQEDLVRDRLVNLDQIKQGQWRAFDRWN